LTIDNFSLSTFLSALSLELRAVLWYYIAMKKISCFLISISIFLIILTSSYADIIILKSNRELEGEIIEEGDIIFIKLKSGNIAIKKKDIKEIIKKPLPQKIYNNRLKNINLKDTKALFELACWCKGKKLFREHEDLLKKILTIDPQHKAASQALYQYQKKSKYFSISQEANRRLKKEAGKNFAVLNTAHYRIAYNTNRHFAYQRAELFESLYRKFYLYFEQHNFKLETIKDRLEAITFDTRAEFKEYTKNKFPSLTLAGGYFHLKSNRMYLFDGNNNADYIKLKARLKRLYKEANNEKKKITLATNKIKKFRTKISKLTSSSRISLIINGKEYSNLNKAEALKLLRVQLKEVAKDKRMFNRYKKKIAKAAKKITSSQKDVVDSTTIHEATHQIAFNSGIHNAYGYNPRWLTEALACFFYISDNNKWIEVGKIRKDYINIFKEAYIQKNLYPLNKLIHDEQIFALHNPEVQISYAQSWALFYFLSRKHNKKNIKYIKTFSTKTFKKSIQPSEKIKIFTDCFGEDLEALEKEWMDYMDTIGKK
jgi:hypothetical protein